MKIITWFLIILLIVLTAGCKTIYVKPDVYCPDPARPILQTPAGDKVIVENYNEAVNYALQKESQVKCYKEALR